MKKYIYFTLIALVAVVVYSCKDQDDIYKQYIVPGGYVYPEKANGANAKVGYNRMIVKWAAPLDPSVNRAVITWSNGEETRELNYADFAGQDSISIEIDDLKEQAYTVNITNYDTEGNKSMTSEVTATPYAEIWLATHSDRTVGQASMSGNNATASVGYGTDEMVGTKFRYVNASGDTVVVDNLVETWQTSVTFTNAKAGTRFEYSSGYCPSEGLDTIWNEWRKSSIPIVGKLDPSGFIATATGYNSGYAPSRAIDGKINSSRLGWQYSSNGKWPVALQVDFGKDTYVITAVTVWNYLSNSSQRTLVQTYWALSNEAFELEDLPNKYAVTPNTSSTTCDWTPYANSPSIQAAKWKVIRPFYNSNSNYGTQYISDGLQARYFCIACAGSRLGSAGKIAIQEIEFYGYDSAAE